jgi:phytoene/squalene synthetase
MPTITAQQVEDAARAMPDHTLAASFLEPDVRARVLALILFHHEVARARSVVSEAGLATIRLHWWRQTIEQIYTVQIVRTQPTALALKGAIEEANLPRHLLDAMIDGYEKQVDVNPFATWGDLESYLDDTFGNLNRLCLLASGLSALTTRADEAARQAGCAWGLSDLMRMTPNWLHRRSLWLPDETFSDLNLEDLFAGHVSASLLTVFGQMRDKIAAASRRANTSLQRAKLGSCFPVLAPACLSKLYANAATPSIGGSWEVKRGPSLLQRQLRITLSVARGRI